MDFLCPNLQEIIRQAIWAGDRDFDDSLFIQHMKQCKRCLSNRGIRSGSNSGGFQSDAIVLIFLCSTISFTCSEGVVQSMTVDRRADPSTSKPAIALFGNDKAGILLRIVVDDYNEIARFYLSLADYQASDFKLMLSGLSDPVEFSKDGYSEIRAKDFEKGFDIAILMPK